MSKKRNVRIDIIKGISILIVILYHLGVFENGYLGVDAFFVIGGYLYTKSILRESQNGTFSFWGSILKRLYRLYPLILIVCLVSLLFGYFWMLPDDLENLSASVIATAVFANNILACITTKNYWDVSNIYKPLMHTWYIAVLFQAYIVMTLFVLVSVKTSKNTRKRICWMWGVLSLISFLGYWLSIGTSAQIFYYLPFRLFEITIGGLIAALPLNKNILQSYKKLLLPLCYIGFIGVIIVNEYVIPAKYTLVLVVIIVAGLLILPESNAGKYPLLLKPLVFLGQASYSFYLWHQVFVAILFYSFVPKITVVSFVGFFVITIVVSTVSYYLVESKNNSLSIHGDQRKLLIVSIAVAGLICYASFSIYNNAGVVRDVPELGVSKEDAKRGMHSAYCDRPYSWNQDFTSSDKVKVVVLGNSFGRDWANILYESEISNELEISYIFLEKQSTAEDIQKYLERLDEAELVFFAMHTAFTDVPEYVTNVVDGERLYVVGDKSFGESNGIFYAQRNSQNYYEQSAQVDSTLLQKNMWLQEKYKDHYIDLMTPVLSSANTVRVFTDDKHFISQDCRHLTKFGAQYYARILDLAWMVNR